MKIALAAAAVGSALAAAVSPTEKVIQMLEDMSAKGKARMEDEQVAFAKFSTFCENESTSLKRQIKEGKALMESLQADILKARTDAENLASDISGLNRDIDGYNADMAAQKKEREDTRAAFVVTEKDLSESVDALARAIQILKRQNFDRKQAASFLQTTTMLPPRAKALVQDMIAMEQTDDDDFLSRSAPEANGYEFQSGGIVDLLKKLETDFKTQLSDAQTAESNSRHAFEMSLQDLTASIAASEESVNKKTAIRQKRLSFAGKSEKELGATTATHEEDTATLSDLTTECAEKSHSYKEKQQLSGDELEALGEAIKILSGDNVSGAASTHLGEGQRYGALLQLSAKTTREHGNRQVYEFLSAQAKKLSSDKLSLLAQKMAADPFLKVKKMIKAMVSKLMKAQNEEAELKGFCDKELKTNKITRDRLNQEMDALSAEFDEQSATAKQLGELIAKLATEVSDLDAAMKESTEQRMTEKSKNTKTIADSKAAQEAVAQATSVLKSFYEKAGAATAFVQVNKVPKMGSDEWQALANPNYDSNTDTARLDNGAGYGQGSEDKVDKGHKAGMQTFGETYSGQQDSANGVLAMLEVIMSDFANLETETKTAEEEAQSMYERFMADSKKDKKVKSRQIEMNQADKKEAEHAAASAKRDLSTTDDELKAADRYYENLKPKCIDEGVSHEERASKRQEEIDSLKEALAMLQPQDL